MAKLSTKKSGGRIVFDQDDWLAGLNPQFVESFSAVPAIQVGNGLSTATRFNPFRYLGYATPGFAPTDVANVSVVTGTLQNIAVGQESGTAYGYAIANNSLLHRLDITNKSLGNSGSWPHTITETSTISGLDVVSYSARTGGATFTPCIFYSFNDSDATTTWNVGRFITSTGAFADTFMSTTPATPLVPTTTANGGNNLPHPMRVGADDILYIGDGNKLHSYDGSTGANGTFNSTVLLLPQGYIITSFARISQPTPFLVVFAYYNTASNSVTPDATVGGPAKAFFYDYLSNDPTYVVDLNDSVVTEAFEWKGTIGCFTQGNNPVNDSSSRNSRLKIWNGSIFETAATFIGNPPIHGGVDVVGNSVQWASGISGATTNLYTYGSPFEDVQSGLNRIGASYSAGQTKGLLRTLGGLSGYQVMSAGTSTSGGLMYFAPSTYAGSASVGTISVRPEFEEGKKGSVRSIRVDFAKTSIATGALVNVYLVTETGTTSQILSNVALVNSSNITRTYYTDVNNVDGNLPNFIELRALVQWADGTVNTDAPVIRRIVVDYDEVNIENS